MNDQLRQMLHRMHEEGKEYDAQQTSREDRRRNLDPETARLISHMMRMKRARRVLELGTSNGYSTVWFADAVAETGGRLTTVDIAQQDEAIANALWAGLNDYVDFVHGDAAEQLAEVADASVDVLFMDSERTQYVAMWPDVRRIVAPGGVLLIDNIHHPAPEELTEFIALVEQAEEFDLVIVPIGSGLGVALKAGGEEVAYIQ